MSEDPLFFSGNISVTGRNMEKGTRQVSGQLIEAASHFPHQMNFFSENIEI